MAAKSYLFKCTDPRPCFARDGKRCTILTSCYPEGHLCAFCKESRYDIASASGKRIPAAAVKEMPVGSKVTCIFIWKAQVLSAEVEVGTVGKGQKKWLFGTHPVTGRMMKRTIVERTTQWFESI